MSFPILHRDTHLLVIDKPAGLAVHPGPKTRDSLEDHFPALRLGNRSDPVAVHRLDRDTSGCLVLARHAKAVKRMAALFEAGRIGKLYWAVVDGEPAEDAGHIDAPLWKVSSAEDGWRMIVDARGKRAATGWEVIERRAGRSLIAFGPETGRTHQVRAHAAALGHPILGDPVYGAGVGPMRLHARSLTIPYDDAAPLTVEAPVPEGWPAFNALFEASSKENKD